MKLFSMTCLFTLTMGLSPTLLANEHITPATILPSLQSLQGLDSQDLQASLDLYKAQINQDNLLMLSQTLKDHLQQHTSSPAFQKSIEQGIGIAYDKEQAKALQQFAQHHLPKIIEKNSPMIAQNIEEAVQNIDSKQVAELINHPDVQKNIGKFHKILKILTESE